LKFCITAAPTLLQTTGIDGDDPDMSLHDHEGLPMSAAAEKLHLSETDYLDWESSAKEQA
jgi:hypothetical protein